MTETRDVLIDGQWRAADASGTFQAIAPATGELCGDLYPVSRRSDIDAALAAGSRAAKELGHLPAEARASFLDTFAAEIEKRAAELVEMANLETALPASPRLGDVELPRTTNQLRQAAAAARDGSWSMPTIDTATGIRSMFGALSAPVAVFGPNNFPFAFNGIAGGDFAAAIAAGNPVIAKANTSHPGTTRLLAEAALAAIEASDVPAATVQLIYRMDHADGEYLVSHPLIGATGYTGARGAGLTLKRAADAVGKPIYLELSSVNPVFFLPGVIAEKGGDLAAEYHGSVLMGTGQFCTNPGICVVVDSEASQAFIEDIRGRFKSSEPGVLLGQRVEDQLDESVKALASDGAEVLSGGQRAEGGCRFQNTLLRVTGDRFVEDPEALQREAFGNVGLFVVASDEDQLAEIAGSFEGNLTGCVYSASEGADDALYDRVAEELRPRVGRLLNDKMPTGVAVSPAMNHGGPFPATGHPGFSAVGIPGSLRRFALLLCYDNVRPHRLPPELQDKNPTGSLWRWIDDRYSTDDVA